MSAGVVSRLPFPIAYPVDRARAQVDERVRLEGILRAYLEVTRFLALVTISQYLREEESDPKTDRQLKQVLSGKMTDGEWVRLLRETLRWFRMRPERFFLPPVLDLYFRKAGRLSVWAKRFEGWVAARNDLVHPEKRAKPMDIPAVCREWEGRLEALVEELAFLGDYDLVQPLKIRKGVVAGARLFRGTSLNFRYERDYRLILTLPEIQVEESLLLVSRAQPRRQLPLSPLIHVVLPSIGVLLLGWLEQGGERLKDAVFVSAAEGTGNRVGRDPELAPLLEELHRLLARLGPVGLGIEPVDETQPATDDEVRAYLERCSQVWRQNGYDYDAVIVLEGNKKGLAFLRREENWPADGEEDEELDAFCLMAALHFGQSWGFWARRNRGSELAIRRLLALLRNPYGYERPRLRALYALQQCDAPLVAKILDEEGWPDHDRKLIRRYVLTGEVKAYLRHLVAQGSGRLRRKADAVVQEIEGMESGMAADDLPLEFGTQEADGGGGDGNG